MCCARVRVWFCVCACVRELFCVCAHICVCEREKEREEDGETCMYSRVCACVCWTCVYILDCIHTCTYIYCIYSYIYLYILVCKYT